MLAYMRPPHYKALHKGLINSLVRRYEMFCRRQWQAEVCLPVLRTSADACIISSQVVVNLCKHTVADVDINSEIIIFCTNGISAIGFTAGKGHTSCRVFYTRIVHKIMLTVYTLRIR